MAAPQRGVPENTAPEYCRGLFLTAWTICNMTGFYLGFLFIICNGLCNFNPILKTGVVEHIFSHYFFLFIYTTSRYKYDHLNLHPSLGPFHINIFMSTSVSMFNDSELSVKVWSWKEKGVVEMLTLLQIVCHLNRGVSGKCCLSEEGSGSFWFQSLDFLSIVHIADGV